ncbi:MAG: hypothetical protein ACTSPD_21545 [Promethearchaeota archaeon]
MKPENKKKLRFLYLFSLFGFGITFFIIHFLGGMERLGFKLFALKYPETLTLKILDTINVVFYSILFFILFHFTGTVVYLYPTDPETTLLIKRPGIQKLIENSKFKKLLLYVLFFGFSLSYSLIAPIIEILSYWFPEFVSAKFLFISLSDIGIIAYILKIMCGGLLLLYLGILSLISYFSKKKDMRTKFIKKSIIKKYLSKYRRVSSSQIIIQIIRWLDDEIEKKFNELIGLLPKRSIVVPEDLEKLPGFDGNISKTELKKVNNQKSR